MTDGNPTPDDSRARSRRALQKAQKMHEDAVRAKALKREGFFNAVIAEKMLITESQVRSLLMHETNDGL